MNFNRIKHYKYFFILIGGISDCLQKFLSFYFVDEFENNIWIFNIFFFSIFSFFILKTKLYIHQYISLISIIYLGIVQIIINLYGKFKFKRLLISFSTEVIYTFTIVINKYSMNNYFCSTFEIWFYEGFFEIIINIILLIYANKDNFSDYYKNLNSKEIRIFILLMFSRLSFKIFSLLTIKYFTPSHAVLLLIIGEISFAFDAENNYKLYLTIIIYSIILFMILVFTEIIELNFCNLQKYTKKNIAERAITETEIPIIKYDDNCRDDSSSEGSDDSLAEIEGYEIEINKKIKNKKIKEKNKKELTNKDIENNSNEEINKDTE